MYLKRTSRVKNELFTKALSVVADVWSGIVMASSTQWNNYTASIRIYYQFLAPTTISWIHWSSASSIPLSPEGLQMRATGWPNKQCPLVFFENCRIEMLSSDCTWFSISGEFQIGLASISLPESVGCILSLLHSQVVNLGLAVVDCLTGNIKYLDDWIFLDYIIYHTSCFYQPVQ